MIERSSAGPQSLAARFGAKHAAAQGAGDRGVSRRDVALTARALTLGADVAEVRSAFADDFAAMDELRAEIAEADIAAALAQAESRAWEEQLQQRIDRLGLTDSHGRPVSL